MDLAGEEAVALAEAHIRAINSRVQVLHTQHCKLDLSLILDRQVDGTHTICVTSGITSLLFFANVMHSFL